MPEPLPFDPTAPKQLPKPKREGFSARDVASVFIKYDGRCATCAIKVRLDGYDIDHIQRVDAGGKHELENWQLLCKPCHKPKTAIDNREAKKGARIRGEKGQRARRERRGGSSIKGGAKLQSRKFNKGLRKKMNGTVERIET